jgi:hypothetical protein
MSYQQVAVGVLFLVILACSNKAGAPAARNDSPAADSTAAPPRAGMELKAMPMLPGFRAHLDSLAHTPAMMRGAMSEHRAEVKHLVDAMHSDMMGLGMPSDPGYEALADSVVKGSVALGTAGGADLSRLVARHVEQLRRLTSVYETKTAGMK